MITMGSGRHQNLTYGTAIEEFREDITTDETTITFTSPVFGFIIYAKTQAIRYTINGVTSDDSMELPAGENHTRNVLTTTIAVKTVTGSGEVYVSGHR